jgi:serine/threonine protein kinase/tetratricopeptide (TPR) repeat protein
MSKVEADHNLLFGLLALQTGLTSQGALFTAFNTWTRDKARSMADILVAQGDLDLARRGLLDGLVDVHLKTHGDDPAKSLAAIEAAVSTQERLAQITDADLAASIALIGVNHQPVNHSGDDSPAFPAAMSNDGARIQRQGQLLAEQRERWEKGDRVLVEEFVERDPELKCDSEALLALIYNEVVLREWSGEAPDAAEYTRRFPELDKEIRRQFDIHLMFSDSEPPSSGGFAERSTKFTVGTSSSGTLRFRVLRPHAKGGLGAVFVALDTELHREVALKQIHDRLADDPTSRRRFLIEAEITGGLEHPGIVPVYGVGTYANGRPFYAMRFVRGDSLKGAVSAFHADASLKRNPGQRSLELQKLLRRFLDVCNAIEYAHSRGVLHRDLKPGNIIVGKHGETLVVDWGLAKSVGRPQIDKVPEERTLVPPSASGSGDTLPGSALGTPAFMSPEQARGDIDRLGPRSDVYSLGATLYVLLTGRPPFGGSDVGAVLDAVWRGDFESPRKFDLSIDRALEAICLKAMERSPDKRYSSPRALGDDIERWIADEPVSAYTEPRSTRARRWARRHRSLVTAAAASLIVALAASITISVIQGVAAQRERDLARQERKASTLAEARLEQVERGMELLGSVFKDLDPTAEEKEHKPLRAILGDRVRQAAKSLDGESVGDALTVAKLQEVLGRTQSNLGNTDEAISLVSRSFQTRSARLGPNHPDTLSSRSSLFALYQAAGRAGEMIAFHEVTLNAQEATLGPTHPDTLLSRHNLAVAYLTMGHAEEAAAEFASALKRSEAALGPENGITVMLRGGLAESKKALGRSDEAAKLHEVNLAVQTRLLGPDHPNTLVTLDNLAGVHWYAGRTDQALALFEQIHKRLEAKLGSRHPDTLINRQNLGVTYYGAGRTREAIILLEETLRSMESQLGADHDGTLKCRASLARCYRAAGRLDESIGLFEATEKGAVANLGDHHPETLRTRASLAATYLAAGRISQAIGLFEPTLRALEADPARNEGVTVGCRYNLAAAYRAAGRADAALALLEATLKIMVTKVGPDDPELIWVRASIAETLRVMGRLDQAVPMFETALAAIEAKSRPDEPRALEIRANLSAAYEALDQSAKSELLARSALERARRQLGPNNPRIAPLLSALGWCLVRTHKGSEAEVVLRECLSLSETAEPDAWTTALVRSLLGAAILEQDRHAAAEPLIVSGFEGMKSREAMIPAPFRSQRLSEAIQRAVRLYDSWGKPGCAALWRQKLATGQLPPDVFAVGGRPGARGDSHDK